MAQWNTINGDAVESLRRCCCEWGLKASGRPLGHHQIWARDSMIASLCALPGPRPADSGRDAGESLAAEGLSRARRSDPEQYRLCEPASQFPRVCRRGTVVIIRSTLLAPDIEVVRAVLCWYEYQNVHQGGLLSMSEASQLTGLTSCTRGMGLDLNCLYAMALRKRRDSLRRQTKAIVLIVAVR